MCVNSPAVRYPRWARVSDYPLSRVQCLLLLRLTQRQSTNRSIAALLTGIGRPQLGHHSAALALPKTAAGPRSATKATQSEAYHTPVARDDWCVGSSRKLLGHYVREPRPHSLVPHADRRRRRRIIAARFMQHNIFSS